MQKELYDSGAKQWAPEDGNSALYLFQKGIHSQSFGDRGSVNNIIGVWARIFVLLLSFASIIHDACGIQLTAFDAVWLDDHDNDDHDSDNSSDTVSV